MGLFRAVRVEVDLGCHSVSIKVTLALSARGFSTPWLVQKDSFMLNIPGWSDGRVGKGGGLVQWLKLPAWKVGDRGLEPHSGLQVSKQQYVSSPK